MTFRILLLGVALAAAGCSTQEEPANSLERVNILPLALDDSYQFRKIQQTTLDVNAAPVGRVGEAASFERARAYWGAIDSQETRRRDGNYYRFFWRTRTPSDVTVRLEYRQAGLANFVKAQERYYPGASGSRKSSFEVTGDEFLESGRVTMWRALLIVDGRIVGLTQSFMWK